MATRKRPTKKQASRPVTGPQSKPHARRSQCAYCNKWFTGAATHTACPECEADFVLLLGYSPNEQAQAPA
ncbi:hypothetical protein [Methylogaea oryzae]|uniref:Uncharacterized protein n=1 Tax=Methylogaea oryzae TaxID=1295382 RepID=A0A8D5AIR4_9GAMM|nr:hypothetical protein [Methylogaea oryzae]BBL72793.1 hypothetical protein MoryE10_33990 [Methylogaea oryzae]